tara:strand:- start:193 stop:729 length:537 start_codon:yes stop_codon:yes gene_type:complete
MTAKEPFNLKFLSRTDIVNSASTFNIDNIFTTEFNTYRLTFTGMTSNVINFGNMRLINSSGSVKSDTNYDGAQLAMKENGSFGNQKQSFATSWQEVYGDPEVAPQGSVSHVDIFNPMNSGAFTYAKARSNHSQGTAVLRSFASAYCYRVAEAHRGIQLFDTLSNQITGGKVSVFGYIT